VLFAASHFTLDIVAFSLIGQVIIVLQPWASHFTLLWPWASQFTYVVLFAAFGQVALLSYAFGNFERPVIPPPPPCLYCLMLTVLFFCYGRGSVSSLDLKRNLSSATSEPTGSYKAVVCKELWQPLVVEDRPRESLKKGQVSIW
jgi:hypothetical protein